MRLCKQCGNEIEKYVTTDNNSRKKLDNRFYCLTCSPYKEHNSRNVSELIALNNGNSEKTCSKCDDVKPIENFYFRHDRNKWHPWCKQCMNLHSNNRHKKTKSDLVTLKGGKCVICGYSKYIGALQFHHIDPSQKDFDVSDISSRNENVINELEKCILVCGNCHTEIHANLIDISKIMGDVGIEPT